MSLPVPVFERSKVVTLFTIVFYLLLITAGLWFAYVLRGLIPPFLIAITIALTLAPEIDRMERRGWRRGLAILVIYALFIGVFAAFLVLLIPFISGQLGQVAQHLIPKSLLAHPSQPSSTAHMTNVVRDYMNRHHVPLVLSAPVVTQVQHIPSSLSGYLSHLSTELPIFAGNLVWIILIPILAFYFLADYHKIMGKTLLFVRADRRAEMLRVLNDVVAVFGNYVRGVVLMMLLDIIVTYCVLRIMHVQFAETVAVLAGILYGIPYLGAVISTVLIGLVALQGATVAKALLVLGIMIFIHQIAFDQVVGPRIIGRQVGLHPLWAIIAMLVGGTVMGVGGTLLAIPLAAGVQVVLVHLYPRLKDDNVALLSERFMEQSDRQSQREDKAERADKGEKKTLFRRRRRAMADAAGKSEDAEAATERDALPEG